MTTLLAIEQRYFEPETIVAHSGLAIEVTADEWQLLPTTERGWKVNLAWLWNTDISEQDRSTILDVYTQYARTKSAGTAATVIGNTKLLLSSGIPKLELVQAKWSGLPIHHKKGLNQFFGTLAKLGRREYKLYHVFTRSNLDQERSNVFDSKKGALNKGEHDSLCASLNLRLQRFKWNAERKLEFFQNKDTFGHIRASVSNKLLVTIVRRPVQLSAMKWSDLVPAGRSFNDSKIDSTDEIGSIGNNQLQLRSFHAKFAGTGNWRALPEKYPIALSVSISQTLSEYKRLYIHGVRLLLEQSSLNISYQDLLNLIADMPVFISSDFFALTFTSIYELKGLFNNQSRAFHCSSSTITTNLRHVPLESSRGNGCIATSNRIRHTVLTRGAQQGLDATTLAKVTGVTTPAARHYIDLDYESRIMIDDLYLGSDYLAGIFKTPLEQTPADDDCVSDQAFNPVGGLRDKLSCTSCLAVMGRPVGCYGCNNFRPILEADHGRVLEYAELKLAANCRRLLTPKEKLSVEKLEKQIGRIKLTIAACEQVLGDRRGIR